MATEGFRLRGFPQDRDVEVRVREGYSYAPDPGPTSAGLATGELAPSGSDRLQAAPVPSAAFNVFLPREIPVVGPPSG